MRHPIRLVILSLLLILAVPFALAQQWAWLMVQHPQQTWRYGTGTIEDATIVLQPKGTHLECDLYLQFSPRGVFSSAGDSVEVRFDFELPPQASVTDMWLWVEEDIMKALILDRWTASTIYEDIVKRRRDPCLVLKEGPGYYSVKIYPLLGNGRRRMKLSYQIPMQWGARSVTVPLPEHLLKASSAGPPMFRVRIKPDLTFRTPRLLEYPEKPFTPLYDSVAGPMLQTEIPGSLVSQHNSMTLSLDFATQRELYLVRYEKDGEGYYQMAFLPYQVLGEELSRRVAISLDYDELSAPMSKATFLDNVKQMLFSHFVEPDSFTVIYRAPSGIMRAAAGWIPASVAAIESTFTKQLADSLVPLSGLRPLLLNAISFVQEQGGGSILLASSSTDYCDYRLANPLINELKAALSPMVSIHVVDFSLRYYKVMYIDGRYFYNNTYLWENITRLTGGAYSTTQDWQTGDFPSQLNSIVPFLRGAPGAFDVQTRLENGFCTSRYTIGGVSEATVSWDSPIHQVGKFYGSFPFIAEFSALVEGQPVNKVFRVEAGDAITGDSSVAQAWAGQWIAAMETEPQTNQLTKQIVDLSLRARVISQHTAFLALEPNDTIRACVTCDDESGGISAVEETAAVDTVSDVTLDAYPNPFNATTTIRVALPRGVAPDQVAVRIFNTLGQVVRTFDAMEMAGSGRASYMWDGKNDGGTTMASGMYIFVLSSPRGNQSKKLMMVK
jgi:Ca-activated chloride channel family protein